MKLAFEVTACFAALSVPAVAGSTFVQRPVDRAGIERVQAGDETDQRRLRVAQTAKPGSQSQHHQRQHDRRKKKDGKAGPNGDPTPNIPEPPGCVFRKGPLNLLV
jgi:hypothetical protein